MLRLVTLGKLHLEGAPDGGLSSRRKELILLAYLARRDGRPLSRAAAAALLWQDRDEQRGRQSVRQALLELRRLVGSGLLVDTDRVGLASGVLELDADAFEAEIQAGQLESAVSRWDGDFLPGAEDLGGEELRSWLEAEREALRQLLREAFAGLVDRARRQGNWEAALRWSERWVGALPLECDGQFELLQLLDISGRRAEARSRYAALRAQLQSLQLEPSPPLVQLGRTLQQDNRPIPPPRTNSTALFTPDLVGRSQAMAELVAAWRSAQSGNSSVVVVVEGEIGIGKTRLCQEFLRWVERDSGVRFRARAAGREGPGPVDLRMLAELADGIAGAPGLAAAPPAALALLAAISPSIRARYPLLPPAAGSTAALTEAFREAVAAVADEAPSVLFIDDLPQADTASREAVLWLMENLPARILLIVTARSGPAEQVLNLPSQTAIRRLKLQQLTVGEVEQLIGTILELDPGDRHHLAARLHDQGGGTPFYVVELISALADEGTLVPTERGVWALKNRGGRLPLPGGVRDVIVRRLGRLTPSTRAALEAAAVLALPFDRQLLAEVSGEPPVAVDAAIEELILQRLIRAVGSSGTYEFTHELVRQHLSREVPLARGEELSSRAIRALESRPRESTAEHAALAHHRARAASLTAASRNRRRRVLVAAGVALVIGTAIVLGVRARSSPPSLESAIAVLPFSVSGSSELSYLKDGMVTLLSTELDGVSNLRVADPRAVLGITSQISGTAPNLEQGRKIAAGVRAGTFVIGDIVEAAGRLRIGAAVYRRGSPVQLLARANVEGTTSQLFELVDAVAGRLLTGLSPSPYEQLTRVAATATSSLPALKSYLEGERLFRSGAFHPAAQAFQRASVEDTTFALAYYWLSVASWWADDSKAIDSAATLAVRYGKRLPERNRRLFQAWDAFLRGDAATAERTYRQILALEPENVEAWLQLGEVLFHSGPRRGNPLAAARLPFERVLYYEPEHTSALLHLARIAASEHQLNQLDSLCRRILTLNPSGEWAIEARALRSFSRGNRAEQFRVIGELRTSIEGRVWNTARYVAVGAQDLEGARELVALLTEPTRPVEVRAFGHVALSYLDLARGRREKAMVNFQRALTLDQVPSLEHRALIAMIPFLPARRDELLRLRDSVRGGVTADSPARLETSHLANLHDGVHAELRSYLDAGLSLRLDDTSAAVANLRELERSAGSAEAITVGRDAGGSIEAELEVRRGKLQSAARHLEEVLRLEARVGLIGGSPFYSQGLERYLYAGLLDRLGRQEEAVRWYGSFSSNSIFDLIFLAPAQVRSGALLERLGRGKEAAQHYRSALKLYQGSDPEFEPLVKEAEAGLARVMTGELSSTSTSSHCQLARSTA